MAKTPSLEHLRTSPQSWLAALFMTFAAAFLARGATTSTAIFPLRVSADHRYLVDQQDRPFLVVGDTAWSLIAQLGEADIDRYLQDRRRRGFNSIIVNLIEHKFSSNPPRTRFGLAPFNTPNDFSTPNPDYFDFAARVVQKACQRGIIVWLAPAYLGYGGGDEGFFREIKAGGPEKLRAFGRFVGHRFKNSPNLIWLLGGDYTPPPEDRWTVTALAESILEEDTNHLMTVHDSPEIPAAAAFDQAGWLGLNTVYSYQTNLFQPLLAEYSRQPIRPFVLIETTYEGEHDSTPDQIRRQAYWAMLAGAGGQFLGNNPIWHFDGPGLFPFPAGWRQALDGAGSRDIARLGKLFRQLPWEQLMPERNHSIVSDGYGNGIATALTAQTPDRQLSITYFPSTGLRPRVFMLDTGSFSRPLKARWINPVSGRSSRVEDSPLVNRGQYHLTTPGHNGAKANDWILILQSR